MRKLLLASVIAIASAAAMIGPANAHVIIGLGMGGGYFGPGYYDPYPRYYSGYYPGYYRYPDYYDDYGGGYVMRYHHRYHHRHCRIELVRHWRHHHWVAREVRVCGY